MVELAVLTLDHGPAVLAFERRNRSYFVRTIGDRGDAYFDNFDAALLQDVTDHLEGRHAFFVILDENGSLVGRCNLFDLTEESARVGYRVAQHAAGRGVATAAVLALADRARREYGLRVLTAATSMVNVASRRVLTKAGFIEVGPANPNDVGGKEGVSYLRNLSVPIER